MLNFNPFNEFALRLKNTADYCNSDIHKINRLRVYLDVEMESLSRRGKYEYFVSKDDSKFHGDMPDFFNLDLNLTQLLQLDLHKDGLETSTTMENNKLTSLRISWANAK